METRRSLQETKSKLVAGLTRTETRQQAAAILGHPYAAVILAILALSGFLMWVKKRQQAIEKQRIQVIGQPA